MSRLSKGFFRLLSTVVLIALVAAFSYVQGYRAGSGHFSESSVAQAAAPSREPAQRAPQNATTGAVQDQFGVFWEAWGLLESEFYGQIPDVKARMYGAIKGMVDSFGDPHTIFLDPQAAAVVRNDDTGSFEGIGASIRLDERIARPRIVHVFQGQPADKAGLRKDDVILKVGDKTTENLSLLEVITLIRGPRGTPVQLQILRSDESQPIEVTVIRDRIDIPVVEARMLDHQIAYLRLTDFNNVAADRLKVALIGLLAQKPIGLIFDMRGNPGGFLHIAVDVSSQFIGQGVLLTEKSKDGSEEVFRAKPGGLATDKTTLPMVVLVDGGTASAAEIVAAAIRDSGRGILIGEKTFGKTSVQAPHSLSDGSELRITIARWFTPKGDQIKDGLTPDIEVGMPSNLPEGKDPQLNRAVQYLLSGK